MELFRPAQVVKGQDAAADWTRAHGYASESEFSFPDTYLSPNMAALRQEDPALEAYLDQRFQKFTEHDYGRVTSLELMDNITQRLILKTNTWMWAWWDTPQWGKLYLYVFYDMAYFFREGEEFQSLARRQRIKETAQG